MSGLMVARRARAALVAARVAVCAAAALAVGSGLAAQPAPSVPSSPPVPSSPSATAPTATLAWQEHYNDPELQALIATALEHNRDLRVATQNVELARAQRTTRDADLWPTLQAGITGARVATNTGGVSTTVSGGLLTTAFEVDLFGRVRQLAQAADAQFTASVALRAAAQSALMAAVASAHANLQVDRALLDLAQQTLRNRQDGLELARRRVAAGAASSLEEAQADAQLQAARAALHQVQRQLAADESTLQLLVGHALPPPPSASSPRPGVLPAWALRDAPAGLSSELLQRRPDIIAAEAQVQAANANAAAARAALFPRISLTASLGQASRDLAGLFAGGRWVWGVAPSLLQPIFDSGRLEAGVKAATASQQIAVAQYDKAIQTAFKEVHDALSARQTLADQLQAVQAQVQAERERLRLAEVRHRLGASPFLEVLDAQRSLQAAEVAHIQVQGLLALNAAGFYKALGGGAGR